MRSVSRPSLFICSLFAIAFCTGALLWSPVSEAAPQTTPAEPNDVSAAAIVGPTGIFTVNSALDTNAQDGVLSFREAIYLANGGTAALGHLLSNSEILQVGGTCSLSGSSNNWGLTFCGANYTDTIHFSTAAGAVIALGSALPVVSDSAPTVIDGSGHAPVIDLAAVATAHNGIRLNSSNNWVQSVDVQNAGLSDFYIQGNYNTLVGVRAWNAARDGIEVTGSYNVISATRIGITSAFLSACNSPNRGNAVYGIRLASGAQYNAVVNSYIGCNDATAIGILGTATNGFNSIGPFNGIGTSVGGNFLSNQGYGIDVNSDSNSIFSNTINFNLQTAVRVNASLTQLYGNDIEVNDGDGILLLGANNLVGCVTNCLFGGISGNILALNYQNGLTISGTAASGNSVFGNLIGLAADGTTAAGNLQHGIQIHSAVNNQVGSALGPALPNHIANNHLDGIRLDGTAHDNAISGNTIAKQFFAGVSLLNSTHDNTIGGAPTTGGNTIQQNGTAGILLTGSSTVYNIIDGNTVLSNALGIRIGASHDNTIGSNPANRNLINANSGDGILLDTFAYSNTIRHNYIGMNASHFAAGNGGNGISLQNAYGNIIGLQVWDNEINYNLGDGILISGTSSYGNRISGNDILDNQHHGIHLDGGAHGNSIGNPSTNYEASNLGDGILLVNSNDNEIYDQDSAFNQRNGIELSGAGTTGNHITLGTARSNALDGINERNGATDNWWSDISVFDNVGLGIDKNAPSDAQNIPTAPLPVITGAVYNGGSVSVSGTATASTGFQTVSIELYRVHLNASGYGDGSFYLGNAPVDVNGHWSLSFSDNQVTCYTAFQTIYVPGNFTKNSSEFSANSCRLLLPAIRR